MEEQEEIAKLQKRLTRYQLKQFEEQEKAEKEMNLFRSPTTVQAGMTTRYMAAGANLKRSISNATLLSNTGLGPIQRGNIVGTGVPIARTPSLHSASSRSLDLMRPYTMGDTSRFRTPPNFPQDVGGRLSVRTGSHQSLFGSTETLDRQHSAFARNLQARYQPLINLGDDMELRQRGPATIQSSVQEYFQPAPQQRMMSTPKAKFDIGSPFGSPKVIKRKAPPPPLTEGLYEYPIFSRHFAYTPSYHLTQNLKKLTQAIPWHVRPSRFCELG